MFRLLNRQDRSQSYNSFDLPGMDIYLTLRRTEKNGSGDEEMGAGTRAVSYACVGFCKQASGSCISLAV